MNNPVHIKSITLKIYLSTALLILLSISVVSIMLYNQYSSSLLEQSSEKAQQVIELSALNIENYLDDLYRLSLSPYYNQDVVDALDKHIDDTDLVSLHRTRTIEDFLEQILIIPRQDILRVFIFTDEIYKGERMPSSIDESQDYRTFDWYKEAMATEEPLLVSAHLEQIIKKPRNIVFSIVRIVRSTRNTDRILGVIKVDANYSSIQDMCDQADFGEHGGVFIIDSKDQIIYSNVEGLSETSYKEAHNYTHNQDSSFPQLILDNQRYLINSVEIQGSDWTMVGITFFDTVNSRILTVRTTAVIIAAISFLASLIIIIIYLNRFLNPLNKIVQSIKVIQSGNLDITFPESTNDELGYLAKALNEMVVELKKMFLENDDLIHQVYEAKYLQKEAQINSLFSQIQPHFIYNTLNMISMLIQSDEPEKAVKNINQLSIMLRGLSNLDKDIRIQTEIDFVVAYLEIQKSRYIDRLDYTIDINTSIHDYMIPALILQPVIENSVIHGCESKKTMTLIEVTDVIHDDYIELIVRDNGVGMSEEQLNALRTKLNNSSPTTEINISDKSSGIALVNVNRRIQIKYGSDYGLSVNSQINEGTSVKITLPMSQ